MDTIHVPALSLMSDYSEGSTPLEEMGFNYQYQLSPDLSELFQYTISEGEVFFIAVFRKNIRLASCPWGPATANGVGILTEM